MMNEQEHMNHNHQTPTSTNQSEDKQDYVLCYQDGTALSYYHASHPPTNSEPQPRRVPLQNLAGPAICAGCRKPIN